MKIDFKQIKTQCLTFYKEHQRWVIGSGIAIIVLVVAVWAYLLSAGRNWDADKVVKALCHQQPDLSVAQVETEAESPTPYLSIAYFNDILIKNDEVTTYAGAIEVFENHEVALIQKEYYEMYGDFLQYYFSEENFGAKLAESYGTKREYIYLNGNVLLRLNNGYSTYQSNQLIKLFNQVLEKDKQTQKNPLDKETLDQMKEENKAKAEAAAVAKKDAVVKMLEEEIASFDAKLNETEIGIDAMLEVQEKMQAYLSIPVVADKAQAVIDRVDQTIQEMASQVEDKLAEALDTLDETKVDEAQAIIETLTHQVFDIYKVDWEARIPQIRLDIRAGIIQSYKDQCETYNYNTLVDDANSYQGNYAYFRGKVREMIAVDDGYAYVVDVTPITSIFSNRIMYWTDPIIVEMEDGQTALEERAVVEIWGRLNGSFLQDGSYVVPKIVCRYYEYN